MCRYELLWQPVRKVSYISLCSIADFKAYAQEMEYRACGRWNLLSAAFASALLFVVCIFHAFPSRYPLRMFP